MCFTSLIMTSLVELSELALGHFILLRDGVRLHADGEVQRLLNIDTGIN